MEIPEVGWTESVWGLYFKLRENKDNDKTIWGVDL